MPTYLYILLSFVLFLIGTTGVILRRNAIIVLMGIELQLNAGNLAFLAFSRSLGDQKGHVFAFFVIALAAAEAAVGLAILQVLVYAGAIMVLFIFVVMILNRDEIQLFSFRGIFTRAVGVFAGGYISYLGATLVWQERFERLSPLMSGGSQPVPAGFGTVGAAGLSLFREFVFPFEAISLLLLVAIVGGVIVSRSAHQTELAEEHEEVHLADPELDVMPGRCLLPLQQSPLAEKVGLVLRGEHAHLVDPAAEVGRHAHVR